MIKQTLTRGDYLYVCNATATQNYSTPAEQQNTLTITDIFGVSLIDPADQETNRTINATYTITITNNGTGTDTYTLTVDNIDSASTAQLNQSSGGGTYTFTGSI